MKGIASYISEALLIVLTIAGISLIVNTMSSRAMVVEEISENIGKSLGIEYVCYNGGYIYAYNYGVEFETETPVEVLTETGWTNTTVVEQGDLFRIASEQPEFVLHTNRGVVVLKP
ncbi:MAG: hypothetical protein ABWW65_00355 [Thermoprotei archaeon]